MPSSAEIAKFIVSAVTRPLVAAEKVGHAAVEQVAGWLGPAEKSRYDRLVEQVRERLEKLPADEVGGPKRVEQILSTAQAHFEAAGLTIDELVRRRLNRDEAVAEQQARFDRTLEAKESIGSICRDRVIPAVFDALFAEPGAFAEIDLAFKQAVLAKLPAIDAIPDATGEVLKGWAAHAMVRSATRDFDPDRHAPSALLAADSEIVPFEGRARLLNEALAWCARPRDLGIRLYFGAGGMGKTRFAIELCRRLDVWRAGFLARDLAQVPDWLLEQLAAPDQPLLIVVDYAETRSDPAGLERSDLARLFELADRLPKGRKLRLVLLARAADDWWRRLPQLSAAAQRLLGGPATDEPIKIGALALEPSDREGVFERARDVFAAHLPPPGRPAERPDLTGADFERVLMIHMAALAAAEGRTITDATALFEDALNRERRGWTKGLKAMGLDLKQRDVERAVTLLTLTGGADDGATASRLFKQARRLIRPGAPFDDLARLVGRLYPSPRGAGGRIEPLRPDLLGEELVDQALAETPELLGVALGAAPQTSLTVLTRLAKRRAETRRWLEQAFARDLARLAGPAIQVAIETGDPIGPVLARTLEQRTGASKLLDYDCLSRLETTIPTKTTAVGEVAVAVMAQMWVSLCKIPSPGRRMSRLRPRGWRTTSPIA